MTTGDQYKTLSEHVTLQLRELILSGAFRPGERLILNTVADRMGVSMMPVREAVRALTKEGLLIAHPHRGARVSSVTPREIYELYEMRLPLEALAVESAVSNLSPKDITGLSALLRKMEREKNPSKWLSLNARFHQAINEASGKQRLCEVIRMIRSNTEPYLAHYILGSARREQSNNEHRLLFEALRSGDKQTASKLIRQHLESARDALLQDVQPVVSDGKSTS